MTITLPFPPTMNHYWRNVGRRTLISAAGRSYRDSCATAARMQRIPKLEGLVSVRGTVFMKRLGCDLDNRIKPILDSLNGIAWADDIQVAELYFRRALDRGNPRVVITIEPLVAA
jgi:crossover junction endodeoxyribonuclease RusA